MATKSNREARPVEGWETFNALADRTLKEASLEKKELTKTFLNIEQLIFFGINHLLYTTTFVEDNLCYLISEIASGTIKSRKVYKGRRIRRRVDLNEGVEMGSENRRIFGIGFDLFKLSRVERQQAAPLVKRIIRSLRIATGNYENILLTFAKSGENYCQISDDLAEVTLRLFELQRTSPHGAPPSPEEEALSLQASDLIDRLDLIEMNVGCVEPNSLYGTIRIVQRVLREVKRLQERVIRAYLRLVLKPTRERAKSEMEAFDLFQSGSLGLARAVSLYDVRSGTGFPTFATFWIRQKIFGAIKNSGRMIKLPGSVWERYLQILGAERQLTEDPDTRYTYGAKEVAAKCGISEKAVLLVYKKVQSTQVTSLESMSSRSSDDAAGDIDLSDRLLVDDSIEEEALMLSQHRFVEQLLAQVDEDQRNLACLRYGAVDSVTTKISGRQALREVFRQAACRAYLQHSMARAAEQKYVLPRLEKLPSE